jgi:hypothetical protein
MITLASLTAYAGSLLDEAAVQRMVEIITPYVGRLLDNAESAQLIGELLFPISFRTLESWPDLRTKSVILNRKRYQRAEDVVEAALCRLAIGQQKRAATLEDATV